MQCILLYSILDFIFEFTRQGKCLSLGLLGLKLVYIFSSIILDICISYGARSMACNVLDMFGLQQVSFFFLYHVQIGIISHYSPFHTFGLGSSGIIVVVYHRKIKIIRYFCCFHINFGFDLSGLYSFYPIVLLPLLCLYFSNCRRQ